MPSNHFHPDLSRIAQFIPKQVITPVTMPIMRMGTRLMGRHTPRDVEVLTLTSGVGVRLYRPTDARGAGPALLCIHGGGYVIGSAAQDDDLCRRFARELGATVRQSTTGWRPKTPIPYRWRTATRRLAGLE